MCMWVCVYVRMCVLDVHVEAMDKSQVLFFMSHPSCLCFLCLFLFFSFEIGSLTGT